jgi:hypothetical protein
MVRRWSCELAMVGCEHLDRRGGQVPAVRARVSAGLPWLTLDRGGRLRLAAEAVGVLSCSDCSSGSSAACTSIPDRSYTAVLAPSDNGFLSDHAAAGGLLTALVVHHRRTLGLLVGMGRGSLRLRGWRARPPHAGRDYPGGQGDADTGWGSPDRLSVLVCAEHRDQLADRALAVPTADGLGFIVRPLAQRR